MTQNPNGNRHGKMKPILFALGAAVIAGAIGIFVVLPAETGIDPTGVGVASGLTEIANPAAQKALEKGMKRKGVLTALSADAAPEPGQIDEWSFELQPYEEIELKYILDENAPIRFSWVADGPLAYDMHAHPFDGGEALTESYAIAKATEQSGRYVAAFSGIHGWHWQNRSLSAIRLTLKTSGQIKGSKVLDGRSETDRPLSSSKP